MGRRVTEEVVRVLRERVVLGHYLGRLPSERALCEQFEASRACVRIALERLSAEGLLLPVSGRHWQVQVPETDAGFELVIHSFSVLDHAAFVQRVAEVLDHRTQHFVASVERLVENEIQPSDEAGSALIRLGIGIDRENAESILSDEDDAMIKLINSGASLPQQLATHQIRRAVNQMRSHLKLDFYLRHLAARFNPLYEAVRWRDRRHARLFAEDVGNARKALYVMLAEEAVEPTKPQEARFIFGEI